MGAELFDNIRAGDWLLDYTQRRIASELYLMPGLTHLNTFMLEMFALVKSLPVSLKPKYFCILIEKIYDAAVNKIF